MLKECTMKEKYPKTDPRTEDSSNAGENKNDGKVSKANKTEENKIKKKQEWIYDKPQTGVGD